MTATEKINITMNELENGEVAYAILNNSNLVGKLNCNLSEKIANLLNNEIEKSIYKILNENNISCEVSIPLNFKLKGKNIR